MDYTNFDRFPRSYDSEIILYYPVPLLFPKQTDQLTILTSPLYFPSPRPHSELENLESTAFKSFIEPAIPPLGIY